jgi:hypothetical protein
MAEPENTRYPITWVLVRFVQNRTRKAWLGFCGYEGHVCKVTDAKDQLTVMVVQYLYHTAGHCQEGERCLYFACPLNRTDRQRDPFSGRRLKEAINPHLGEFTLAKWNLSAPDGGIVTGPKGGPLIELTIGASLTAKLNA